jgi:hypothetical protein
MDYQRALRSLLFIAALLMPSALVAQSINITGAWTGATFVGPLTFLNDFAFVQRGSSVTGSNASGVTPGFATGTITGNTLQLFNNFPSIGYSSNSTATITQNTISGTFIDSQGTSGTFILNRVNLVLTPTTTLVNPPIPAVKGKTVTLTFLKFNSIAAQQRTQRSTRASKRLTPRYTVTLQRGTTRTRLVTKRNSITVKSLKAGTYTASYKVSAIRNGKTVYTTASSPSTSFTIR